MTNNINAKELLAKFDISDVVGRFINLKKKGTELVALCPFHKEKTPSLYVNDRKGIYKCFGCGAGGDAINFVQRFEGVEFQEALEIIDKGSSSAGDPEKRKSRKKAAADWTAVFPVPLTAPKPPREHYAHGRPSRGWQYRDADGNLLGFVARFDTPDGKEVLPLTYRTDGSRSEWRWQGFPAPRPIYNLPGLSGRPEATVIIAEGEKAADAAAKLFPGLVAIAWPGGARAIHLVDWTPLRNRRVVVWPDADNPGVSAAFHLSAALAGIAAGVRYVVPDPAWPKGFDAADVEGWEKPLEEIRSRLSDVPALSPISAAPSWLSAKFPEASGYWEHDPDAEGRVYFTVLEPGDPYPLARYVMAPDAPPAPDEDEDEDEELPGEDPPWKNADGSPVSPIEDLDAMPFRSLGYNKSENGQNEFYVYASKPNQVLRMSPGSFSKAGLMQLADLNWWESRYPGRNGLSLEAAAQFVINSCYDRGVYDLDNVRGVGAWLDEGRPVIHAGSHLVVDGRPSPFLELRSRFIYEAGKDFGLRLNRPLSPAEAVRVMDLAKMMRWERSINAYLFVGWCVIAPVCGALYWRPHIWLTGGAGSGKSTAIYVLKQLIGKLAVHLQAMTTEAGIRQVLQSSARPVLFDELDVDNVPDAERVKSILGLVRASSSHDGGEIGKGGQSGTAKLYKIRSCFAFASITPQVATGADKSRVTVLSLLSPSPDADEESLRNEWHRMEAFMTDLLSEEYCERFLSRTISLLPVIIKNAKVFARAATVVLGEQRAGDQLGTIIAGAHSLYSSKEVSYDEAVAWLRDKDWEDIRNKERDEIMLFNHLMEQITSVETGAGTRVDRQVGELILIASKPSIAPGELVPASTAADRLLRIGFRVEVGEGYVVVSNTSDWIKKVLRGSRWAENYDKVLKRLEGARALDNVRFGSGIKVKGVAFPISLLER